MEKEGQAPPPPYGLNTGDLPEKKQHQQNNNNAEQQQQPQTITIQVREFGEEPVQMICPQCGAEVISGTKEVVGTYTYLNVAICCFFFGICGLIPCCMRSCKDIEHVCPHCEYNLGVYRRSCS